MKKRCLFCLILLMLVAVGAVQTASGGVFEEVYMVRGDMDKTQTSEFELSQIPWLYVKLYQAEEYCMKVSWWYGLDPIRDVCGNSREKWVSLEEGYDPTNNNKWTTWDEISQNGTWSVRSEYRGTSGRTGNKTITFEVVPDSVPVVPEPTSLVLFTSGLAFFALRSWRKSVKPKQQQ